MQLPYQPRLLPYSYSFIWGFRFSCLYICQEELLVGILEGDHLRWEFLLKTNLVFISLLKIFFSSFSLLWKINSFNLPAMPLLWKWEKSVLVGFTSANSMSTILWAVLCSVSAVRYLERNVWGVFGLQKHSPCLKILEGKKKIFYITISLGTNRLSEYVILLHLHAKPIPDMIVLLRARGLGICKVWAFIKVLKKWGVKN